MAQTAYKASTPYLTLAITNSTRLWEQELGLRPARKKKEIDNEGTSSGEVVEELVKAIDYGSNIEYLCSLSSRRLSTDSMTEAASTSYHLEFRLFNGGSYVINDSRLYFLIRSQAFADVEVIVPNQPSPPAAFLSYSAILSSRSPHFRRLFQQVPSRSTAFPGAVSLTLPESSFTPESFSFILGYFYSGSLRITKQECGLQTAFNIYRGSKYLQLPVLQQLISAQIMVEMLHGLYCAPLSNIPYSQLAGREWSTLVTLGCRCWSCARQTPQVLQFAVEPAIDDPILERGARRAMTSLFGLGWCTSEFAALPNELFKLILDDIQQVITPFNIFPLLFEAEKALLYLLDQSIDFEGVHPRESVGLRLKEIVHRIESVRDFIDKVFYTNLKVCFQSDTWKAIINSAANDENAPVVRAHWIMSAIKRIATPQNAATLYEFLGNSIGLQKVPGLSTSRIGVEIEELAKALLQLMLVSVTSPLSLPVIPVQAPSFSIVEHISGDADSVANTFGRDSSSSYYSCISTPPRVLSPENPIDIRLYVPSLNPGTSSEYSSASSRTVSTDYGVYYTRRAISQEFNDDSDSIRTVTGRKSWDSFQFSPWAAVGEESGTGSLTQKDPPRGVTTPLPFSPLTAVDEESEADPLIQEDPPDMVSTPFAY